jgi:hypothetical protein
VDNATLPEVISGHNQVLEDLPLLGLGHHGALG